MGTTGNRVNWVGFLVLMLLPFLAKSQQPFINKITPNRAEIGSTIEITGLNLSGSPIVFFGGIQGTVLSSNNNLIQVEVPAGASNSSIYVINNGKVAQSSEHFYISFGGTEVNAHDPEFAVSTNEFAASDLCLCDLNGDEMNDLVVVQNREADQNAAEATIFLNNTVGTSALSGSDFQISQSLNIEDHNDGFIGVDCNDYDNDGIKDLAFTSNFGTDANDIFILRNPGSGIFPTSPTVTKVLPTTSSGDQRQPGSIISADLDRDGLLDLVVGNNAIDGVFHIFRNSSTPGNISFQNALAITSNDEPTGLLLAADLNGDGSQDIISLPFRESNSGINLFRNLSRPGSFNFEFDQTITNGGQTSDIEVGDLDNDGDLEIVVASNLTGRISYFENQSTEQLFFGGSNNLSSSATTATGVSLADINGDGVLDIVSSNGAGGIFIFPNTTSSIISFGNQQVQSTGGSTRNLVTGDLNGDAKPDIAYTRDVQLEEIGSLGIILNRNCIVPEINPQELEFCIGDPFTLRTLNAANATINWQVLTGNGTITTNGNPEAEITITSGSNATIRVTVTQDDCSESSENLNLSVAGGTPPGTPSINATSAGILCAGDVVTLSSSLTSDNYFWTLPDGSETNSATIQLDPVSPANAGTYRLRIQDTDGCISDEVSRTVIVSSPPSLSVINSGLANFCDELELQVPDYSAEGITYQWVEDGTNLVGETGATLAVSQTGTYSLQATNTDDCSIETSTITLNKIDLPVSDIDGPTETCLDVLTSFDAASIGEPGFALSYEWTIQNSSNVELLSSTMDRIDFSFSEIGDFSVSLRTSYNPNEVYPGPSANDMCDAVQTITVSVSEAPQVDFTISDLTPKCQDEAINVGISSPLSASIASYSWSIKDGNTTLSTSSFPSVDVTTPIGIDTIYAVVEIITDIGCTVQDSIRVRNFISDVDISSPDFPSVVSDDSVTLEESIFINLTAENLVSNIAWEPASLIDNPTANSIQYFPRTPSSSVRLSGVDADGCNVATEVTIYLDNIRPKKTFSPNGDGINDCWEILNIGDLGEDGDCEVYIFDSRGRNLTNTIASFTDGNCVWDGTSEGSEVPEGIYYFVLKCREEAFSKSGSILLAR